MSVKCLSDNSKEVIGRTYSLYNTSIKELAEDWNVSPRTIGRVLEEQGFRSPVTRLQEEANTVMKLLKKHQVTLSELRDLLEQRQEKPKKRNDWPALFYAFA